MQQKKVLFYFFTDMFNLFMDEPGQLQIYLFATRNVDMQFAPSNNVFCSVKINSNHFKKLLVWVISLSGEIEQYLDVCMAKRTYCTSLTELLCFLFILPTTKSIGIGTRDPIHYSLQLNRFSMEQGPRCPDPLKQKQSPSGQQRDTVSAHQREIRLDSEVANMLHLRSKGNSTVAR